MSIYGDNISYNSVVLEVTGITPVKKQKTRKSVLGKSLIQTKIIGYNDTQWELQVSGMITNNLSAGRAAIEALDCVTAYNFVDGIHDCVAYMTPGSLQFQDKNDRGNQSFVYSFTLVEE